MLYHRDRMCEWIKCYVMILLCIKNNYYFFQTQKVFFIALDLRAIGENGSLALKRENRQITFEDILFSGKAQIQ